MHFDRKDALDGFHMAVLQKRICRPATAADLIFCRENDAILCNLLSFLPAVDLSSMERVGSLFGAGKPHIIAQVVRSALKARGGAAWCGS